MGLLDVGARADREDLAVLDRQRLGGRLRVVHRDDVAAGVDGVSGIDLLLRRRLRLVAASDQSRSDQECER